MSWSDPRGQSRGLAVDMLPHNPNAHVITNVNIFDHCRRDRFCRCRRCKPPLKGRS